MRVVDSLNGSGVGPIWPTFFEHVTLELQALAGTQVGFGRARETDEDGVYRVAIEYEDEDLARACLEQAALRCVSPRFTTGPLT